MDRRNLKRQSTLAAFWLGVALFAGEAWGFPALVLGEGDALTSVVAGKVVIVRKGRKTVLTVAPEVRSSATRLAVIVPVPGPIEAKNANVADPGLIQNLDDWATPRVVVLKDPDPCPLPGQKQVSEPRVVGVANAQRYDEGDYDFEPLNGQTLSQVKAYLVSLGFKLPPAAEASLKPYLRAKDSLLLGIVRLKAAPAPTARLRPLQVAFESDAYEVPMKLGPLIGSEPVDLTVYAVSDKGRVDTQAGLGAPRAPSGDEIPAAVLLDPTKFYQGMLNELAQKRPGTAVLEYAWPGTWCEPCAADALSYRAWRKLGVFWLPVNVPAAKHVLRGRPAVVSSKMPEVFVTRLHMMYGAKQQKHDLHLKETGDQNNFQARFVVREPFQGKLTCASGSAYTRSLPARREKEALALSRLTGWDMALTRREADAPLPKGAKKTWVDDLWKD